VAGLVDGLHGSEGSRAEVHERQNHERGPGSRLRDAAEVESGIEVNLDVAQLSAGGPA